MKKFFIVLALLTIVLSGCIGTPQTDGNTAQVISGKALQEMNLQLSDLPEGYVVINDSEVHTKDKEEIKQLLSDTQMDSSKMQELDIIGFENSEEGNSSGSSIVSIIFGFEDYEEAVRNSGVAKAKSTPMEKGSESLNYSFGTDSAVSKITLPSFMEGLPELVIYSTSFVKNNKVGVFLLTGTAETASEADFVKYAKLLESRIQ